jgi:hypothetical protein
LDGHRERRAGGQDEGVRERASQGGLIAVCQDVAADVDDRHRCVVQVAGEFLELLGKPAGTASWVE